MLAGPVTATTVPGRHSLTSRNLPPLYRRRVSAFSPPGSVSFTCSTPPVTFSQLRRVPASSLTLNTRAPNSPQAGGIRVRDCRPCSRPSRPSSRKAAPKKQGNTCRRAIAISRVSCLGWPSASTSSISGSLHRARASGSGAVVKSTQPSPNRPRSSRRRTAASAPGRSILLTKIKVGTR